MLLGPTSRELVVAILACLSSGIPFSIAPRTPARLAGDMLSDGGVLQQRCGRIGATTVLACASTASPEVADDRQRQLDFSEIYAHGTAAVARSQDAAAIGASAALIQFTSGTTGEAVPIVLSRRQLISHVRALQDALEVEFTTDRFVSWLPLYHDMGLLGMTLFPMLLGVPLALIETGVFVKSPLRWLDVLSRFSGTFTAAPDFAYQLVAKLLKQQRIGRLDRVRIAANGGELIDPGRLRDFVSAASRFGFSAGAALPVYGMAEATLCVTTPAPGSGLRTVSSQAPLEPSPAASIGRPPREYAILGPPLPSVDVEIHADVARPLDGWGELEVGEIVVRGPSISGSGGLGSHATGDLGFLVEEELVVVGRIKDAIQIAGATIIPEELERVVACSGIRGGGVAAFGVSGGRSDDIIIVVEAHRSRDPNSLIRSIRRRVASVTGRGPKDVVLVGAGTIPKTSSGKIQRGLCRKLWAAGELGERP